MCEMINKVKEKKKKVKLVRSTNRMQQTRSDMQARVSKEFDAVTCKDNPFVKELYKKARTSAKKYESTLRALEKIKAGGKIDDDQKKKVQNQALYLRSVEESLETLALFVKCQPKDDQVPEGA